MRTAYSDLVLLWKVVEPHGAVPMHSRGAMMEKQFLSTRRFFSLYGEEQFRLTSGYFSVVKRYIDWAHGEDASTADLQIGLF